MKKRMMTVGVMILLAAICTANVHANGYKILGVKSTKASGMGEAFIVQADDPSAIAFNPAGLAQLDGHQVNVQATICNGYTEHTSPSGVKTDNVDKWQAVPSIFATTDMGKDDMAVGIGISFPNGLSSEWQNESFARYVGTYNDLIVADISPAFGMKAGDNLMIGGALNLYYSKAQLESMIDSGVTPNGVDVARKIEGDGTALGANIGVIYAVNDKHSMALTYKLPFSIDYDGDIMVAGSSSSMDATVDFPAVVVLGYAFKPSDKLKVELNLDWTAWSSVDDITITPAGLPTMSQRQDLDNTMAYKLGAEYQRSETLALRCGYIFNENATPDASWRPSLPDTDTHFFTAGFGRDINNITIDAALQLVYYETRTIDNNVDFNELASLSSIDGTYRTWAPCASVSATYRF